VAAVCFGAFMGQLDASVVTLTYRPVEADFHAGLAGVEWVSLAYLITLIALLVPVGRLSDAHGRKLLYLYGFVLFTAASVACGLAPSLAILIACRVVQAAGAALLQANSVALVTTSAPLIRRRDALGLQAGAQALGLALGPTLGGILVFTVGWRWVYFINVPVGVVALIAGVYLLPRTRDRRPMTTLDWPSVGALGVATTALLGGISVASGGSPSAAFLLGSFLVAGLAGWAFVARQRRLAEPLINMALFADPLISWGLVGALCGYFVLFGPLVLVPIAFAARGVSVLTTGLTLTALPAGFAVAAVAGAAVIPDGLDGRRRATVGAVISLVALGLGLFGSFTAASLAPVLALVGIGLGVFTPSNNSMIMGAVPADAAATGGGLLNLTRGLGTALGVAAVTLALHLGSFGAVPVQGDRLAILILMAAALTAALASWIGPREARRPVTARLRSPAR
jgi:MFS family permease